MAHFETLNLLPVDPIFGLMADFKADLNPNKVNIGIGIYRDEEGHTPVFKSVAQAEAILAEHKLGKEYLPIEGDSQYCQAITELVLGADLAAEIAPHIAVIQTVGGTSALRLGGELLAEQLGIENLYMPVPTWPNHPQIFHRLRWQLHDYLYYDSERHCLHFDALCDSIRSMHRASAILLHGCCHNPTGIDPSPAQWEIIEGLIKEREAVPLFDLAYQGLGDGLHVDAGAVRLFARSGRAMLVAVSFSKNFGLYGERIGALMAISQDAATSQTVLSHLSRLARCSYSNPPLHGARLVKTVLGYPTLKALWEEELEEMRQRLLAMRCALQEGLQDRGLAFPFLAMQKGMFSFCGLSQEQVEHLRSRYGIYMPRNGRVNVSGLNARNLPYVVQSLASVWEDKSIPCINR